jgi:uncharacterized protein (TIGR03382 family)
VALTAVGGVKLFSDQRCTVPAASVTLAKDATSAVVFALGESPGPASVNASHADFLPGGGGMWSVQKQRSYYAVGCSETGGLSALPLLLALAALITARRRC